MPKTRVILELGSGNDLHGSDYTKAALRAVQDALHHSSLSFVRSLQIDKTKLDVEVTIGVQRPEQVDIEKVKNSLPVGTSPRKPSRASSMLPTLRTTMSRLLPAQPSRFASRWRDGYVRCTIAKPWRSLSKRGTSPNSRASALFHNHAPRC